MNKNIPPFSLGSESIEKKLKDTRNHLEKSGNSWQFKLEDVSAILEKMELDARKIVTLQEEIIQLQQKIIQLLEEPIVIEYTENDTKSSN